MDRVVIITGSTRGIGFATAAEFLRNGDRVVIFCRHGVHGERAGKRLLPLSPSENMLTLSGDIRRGKDVKNIVGRCLKHFGRIDILINNAGIAAYQTIDETSERQWDDILDTNLKGTFLFLREVLPAMRRQGGGTIINISSAMGVQGEAKFSAYCASKFGVIGLTQAVADETSGSGIRVYAVLPWAVDTTLLAGTDLGLDPSKVLSPEYVAGKIFKAAGGRRKSGSLLEVYP
ncbi:MAG: SDR family oxidoreductase [Nitrospirae bacterium]|nr:SDR family oxidoreductase [Nitrospirota bacterium]